MTIDHGLQCRDEPIEPRAVVEAIRAVQHVRIAIALQQMVEQNAFLERSERINIRDVGRATGHRRHDRGQFRASFSRTSGSISGVIAVQPAAMPLGATATTPLSLPAARANCAGVGVVKSVRTSACRPRRCIRSIARTAKQRVAAEFEEVVVPSQPAPGRAARTTDAAIADLGFAFRRLVRARGDAPSSGAGSARRSSLPFGVSGSASSRTKAAGTMYSGSAAQQVARSDSTVGARSPAGVVGHQALVPRRCPRAPRPRPRARRGCSPAAPRSRRARCGSRGS